MRELIAYGKANPGKLSFGAGSTSSRMASEMLKARAGFDMARHWFRLAEQQDDESASLEGSAPPPAAEDSRPVAQQQQQVQPKEDEKND